jgi:endonuclease YncB( thermonuclease family)
MNNRGVLLAGAVLGLLLALGAPIALAQLAVRGYARVLDGDTLDVQGVRIRLFGIDAPEKTQTCTLATGASWPCGSAAQEALERKLGNRRVTCQRRDVDTYGRVVAVCRLGSEDISAWLAGAGWVVAYRQFSDDYVDEEAAARRARLNLWKGSFELPADYRRRERQEAERPAASEPASGSHCRIKGNISRSGERVYHVPGGEFYAQTVITPAAGERLFCSEQEARAAGWRRAQR